MSEVTTEVGTDQAMWSGHASIYRAPDGGLVLAYRRDGEDESFTHHIPGLMVSLAQRLEGMGESGLLGMLKAVARRGGD